jgi:dTMP kinase
VIRPALAEGRVVVCERWHYSTRAYQGVAGGVSEDEVRAASAVATQGLEPDRAVLLDLPDADAGGRLDRPLDRIEERGAAYRARVAAAFRTIFLEDPGRLRIVSARGTPDEVAARVHAAVADVLGPGPS